MIWPFRRSNPVSRYMNRDLTYRDPLELPRVGLHNLQQSSNSVWVEREAGPYPAAPRQPAFYDRTPGGMTDLVVELPPSRPAVFTMVLDDVLLTGSRGLVTRDGHYCFDENFPDESTRARETERLGSPEIHINQWMGFSKTAKPGVFQLREEKPVFKIDEPVILLTSSEGPNFGAFIYRMLPKLVAASRLDPELKIMLPLFHDSFRQFLVAAGVDNDRIIHHSLGEHWHHLKRVYVPSIRNRDVWFDKETTGLFDRIRDYHSAYRRGGRMIYLSRKAMESHPRKMVNEPELIDALMARGFEIVIPEQLTAVEQIQTFATADIIVAAAGSAIYNAAFCRPGTRFLDIESEPHWVRGHIRIFASRGLEYGVFEGFAHDTSGKPHVQFEVDVRRLMLRLDDFMEPSQPKAASA